MTSATRLFTAATLSLSLGLTSVAAPARADRDEVIAGAIVLGLLGAAYAQQRQRQDGANRQKPPAPAQFDGDPLLRPIPADDPRVMQLQRFEPAAPTPGTGGVGWTAEDIYGTPPAATRPSAGITLAPIEPAVTPSPPRGQIVVTPLDPGVASPAPQIAGTAGLTLPGACIETYDDQGQNRRLFAPDCLSQSFAGAADLPLTCAVTVRALNRFSSGYDPACLRAEGYRFAEG